LIIGGVGGLLVVLGILLLDKLMIDDPVGAWPVHGLCGVWGGLATGIFGDLPDGITSVGGFFTVQLISTVAIVGWTVVTMSIVFGALKVLGMLRVSQQEEHDGLDIHEHGLHAYPDM
jgi:Amt family ammonium transporter